MLYRNPRKPGPGGPGVGTGRDAHNDRSVHVYASRTPGQTGVTDGRAVSLVEKGAAQTNFEARPARENSVGYFTSRSRSRNIHQHRSEEHTSELQSPTNLVCR